MLNSKHPSIDNLYLKEGYDQRYDGDYMDADAYSTWVHEGLAAHRVKQTLQHIPNQPARILDYGCGQGKWTPLLHALFPKAEIVGLDISEVAAEKAARKYPRFRFLGFDGARATGRRRIRSRVFFSRSRTRARHWRDGARYRAPFARRWLRLHHFPCGNKHSFEERFVSLLKNGRERSPTGEQIFFFEKEEGHLHRLESAQTITFFNKEGLTLRHKFYSGQFFAALDWLVRGAGPHYINGMFRSVIPVSSLASFQLRLMRKLLIGVNRFLGYKNLDLTKRRSMLKQPLVRLVSKVASMLDAGIMKRARREWDRHRDNKAESVQNLIFQKSA